MQRMQSNADKSTKVRIRVIIHVFVNHPHHYTGSVQTERNHYVIGVVYDGSGVLKRRRRQNLHRLLLCQHHFHTMKRKIAAQKKHAKSALKTPQEVSEATETDTEEQIKDTEGKSVQPSTAESPLPTPSSNEREQKMLLS